MEGSASAEPPAAPTEAVAVPTAAAVAEEPAASEKAPSPAAASEPAEETTAAAAEAPEADVAAVEGAAAEGEAAKTTPEKDESVTADEDEEVDATATATAVEGEPAAEEAKDADEGEAAAADEEGVAPDEKEDTAGESAAGTDAADADTKEDTTEEPDASKSLDEPLQITVPDANAAIEAKESTPSAMDQSNPPILSIDEDAPVVPALVPEGTEDTGGSKGLIIEETVATPEGCVKLPQEMASPASVPEFLGGDGPLANANDDDGAEDPPADAKALETLDGMETEAKSRNSSMVDEEDESEEHATIQAVVEPEEKSTPVDADMEAVLERIRDKLPCESVEVLESGEILVLPKGWSTRQSKTNDLKTYYVSPYGHTQWLRPPMKTGVLYNWVHEIEVTFGPGRLGLNLKQIAGLPGTEFTDIQVHIAEIYKLPNGMASPAEIYNWSVKPEKRLAVGMRMTTMNGISLTGYTYAEVLEMLVRLPRPVRIKFADISKGIVGRVEEEIPHEETEEAKEARAARMKQSSLRMEYFRILVALELHQQVWGVSNRAMHLKEMEVQKKCELMATQVELEHERHEALEKERENLIEETASLQEMIKQLDLQDAGEIESPEVAKTTELEERNAELEKEIAEIVAENDQLQAARVEIEESLDNLQKELDEYGDLDVDPSGTGEIKFFSPAFLGSLVQRGSIDTRSEDARERLLEKIKAQHDHLGEEIKMEEERAKFVESEIQQFKKQMDVAAAASKREDDFISGERPPQMIFLENRITLLRKNLRETVAGLAKASNSGDKQQADNLSLRRAGLKDDLKNALDEMQRMESELEVFWDTDRGTTVTGPPAVDSSDDDDTVDIDEAPEERVSESSRLQNKLTRLQAELHDTVILLAKAAGEKDDARKAMLSTRRLQLKDEMKVVQDEFRTLTNATLNVGSSYMRPSVVGPPSVAMHDIRSSIGGRRSSGASMRGSMGGRASVGGTRGSMGGTRGSIDTSRPSGGARASERFDPNASRRSSSSMSSLTQSFNSNSNQAAVKDGSLPTMSGLLRKHPTHSNEKGAFGNMSLRGVRERWCVIEADGHLRYYKRQGDREPRGAIPLKHKSLEILHGKSVGKPNEFMISSPTHQTKLAAKNAEEMRRWVKALETAHKVFMQQELAVEGSVDNGGGQESISSAAESPADNATGPTSPASMDPELAYRNKRATLGF